MTDERLDQLIYLAEMDAATNEAIGLLFPEYDPTDSHLDQLVTTTFLENYNEKRAIGLPIDKAANAMNYSGKLVRSLLLGEGLSPEKFIDMARAEVFADSEFRYKHLETITNCSKTGDWRASLGLLERVEPDDFAQRSVVESNVIMSAADCEKKATAAREELAQLRKDNKGDE